MLCAAIAAAGVLLSGCETLGYYAQAFQGQAELWHATRPIEAVIADPEVPSALKDKLHNASRIREFASTELGLPDNRSYRGYADLKRQYVVWNIFATDPFSVKPRQWCFPIAGCVAYKGYFSQARAEAHAAELKRGGDDVFLGGVPAYSTLGYLNDPVLNTFVHYPPGELARLIFHELAHQAVYVSGDTVFNESFAVTVEREGVRRWMERHGTPVELEAFHKAQQRRAEFHRLALAYRARLEQHYESGLPAEQMAAGKQRIFAQLHDEYESLKRSWDGFRGYDRWLGPSANNASLASIAVYTHLVPAFQVMLESVGYELPRFYQEVRRMSSLPKAERHDRLARLQEQGLRLSAH
jgi:predicted aminopeptidase